MLEKNPLRAAQQRFAAIARQLNPKYGPNSLLGLLTTDPRMQPVWVLLANHSEGIARNLLCTVVAAAIGSTMQPHVRDRANTALSNIRRALSAAGTLRKLSSTPLSHTGDPGMTIKLRTSRQRWNSSRSALRT